MEQSLVLTPIGVIRTPFTSLEGMPIQPGGACDVLGRAELRPELAPALADLDGFSHVYLLYWFHHCPEGCELAVTPFLDDTPRGLFSTRAPRRPNPIGMSLVEVVSVVGAVLTVRGADVLDGTPLLDIKPYAPAFDAPLCPVRSGWLEAKGRDVTTTRADGRFV